MKKHLLTKTFLFLAFLIWAQVGWGQETIIYSTGFETSDGFTAGTVYNNATIKYDGPEGQKWGTYYGTASTTGYITGAMSMQMRYYTTAPANYGYTYTNFDLTNVSRVTFNAKDNASVATVTVSYSIDGGINYVGSQEFTLATTAANFEYVISATGEYPNVRIKFSLTGTTVAERLTIDDVVIYGIPIADTDPPVATFDPLNAATDVAISVNPTISFDEAIYTSPAGVLVDDTNVEGLITFTDGTNPVAFTATISSNVITIVPGADLDYNLSHTITLPVVQDEAGNPTSSGPTATFTTRAESNDATISSGVYTVDNGLETITDVPGSETLATFEGNLTPATYASFETYESDGTTVATDLQTGYKVIVTAEASNTKTYVVTLSTLSDAKDILTYSFAEQTGAAIISDVTHTVDIEVAYGTDVTTLVATFTISTNASAAVGATPQVSGTTPNNFTSPVVYTITAEDASTQDWTVTVTEAAPSTDATVSSTVYTVDNGLETIIDIPYYEILAAFEASITPAADATFETYESDGSTVATDLQSGYKVICTAQDGITTKTYTITLDVAPAADLFFSEYIEGSSNNKAIEIYNGTGGDVDLSTYVVKIGFNGGAWSATATPTSLTGNLANGSVYVIVNSSAIAAIKDVGDIEGTVATFNGDDAVGLFKDDVLIDIIGVQGIDPGTNWPVAGTGATSEYTLVRKSAIVAGTTDWNESAGTTAENSQWEVYPQDNTSYLGWHIAKSTEKDILSFSLAEQTGVATINDVVYIVDIEVAKGTVLTALVPTITVSNRASVSPESGVAQDFTSPVTYTVTAQDATTQDWTVTVTIYKSNDATVSSGVYTVDNGLSTITNVPYGTTLATFESNITPATDGVFETYEADGTTVATDLQDGYKVICTAEDGITTKTYTITVTPASTDATISSGVYTVDDGLETITNVPSSETLATFEGNLTPATFASFETYESDGTTVAADLQTDYKVIVTAQAGNTKTYTVTKNAALSDAKDILTYSFAEQTGAATISDVTHTVGIEVAYGTDVTNLVATYTISAGATVAVVATPQESGTTPNDFTSPVVYTVTAEDASTQEWTVTVTEEAPSTDATISSGVYTVDNGLETITDVPYNETLATFEGNLTPATDATFETYESDGTTVAADLASGYKVIVTAQDGLTKKTYTITLNDPPVADIYEGFDYAAGLTLQTQTGWTAVNSGDDLLITEGSLSFSGLKEPTGNKVAFAGAGIDAHRSFSEKTSGTVYYSFILRVTDISAATDPAGGYFAAFGQGSGSNTFGGTIWTKKNGDNFNIGINTRTTVAVTQYSSETYSINNEIFVIASYQFNGSAGDDVCKLWINPSTVDFEAETAPAADITVTNTDGTDMASISSFLIRQDSNGETPAIEMDELRVGLTWAEVTPSGPIVPKTNVNVTSLADFGSVLINNVGEIERSFTVSGSDLTNDIVITAPAGFEISTVSGVGFTNTNPINLSPTAGTVTSTPIYVKFHPTLAQAYTADITITSVGVTPDKAVAVSGTGLAPSTDATLSDLQVDAVTVTGFVSTTYDYVVTLPYGTTITPTVTVTENHANATSVIVPATDITSATAADRTTTITVTAQDGITIQDYTVLFNVTPASTDATLSAFTVNSDDVLALANVMVAAPADAGATKWFDNFTSVAGIGVTANEANATVVVKLNDAVVDPADYATQVLADNDVVLVTVTAQDATTIKYYKVTMQQKPIITASAGENGTIDPTGAVVVNYDGTQAFDIDANTGYHIASVLVDGSGVPAAVDQTTYLYEFTNVVADHTIAATFALTTYTVTFNVSDGTNPLLGATVTLTGYGDQITDASGVATFTNVAPATIAYTVVLTDYNTVNNNLVVDGNETVPVTMVLSSTPTYSVIFTVKEGETALEGATVALTGYGIQTTNASGVATFEGVAAANNIAYTANKTGYVESTGTVDVIDANVDEAVSMTKQTFTIAASAGTNGTITPTGDVVVTYGNNQAFDIEAATGYHIASLLVDGSAVTEAADLATYTYTFTNVTAAHIIAATFAINTYTITVTAGANGTTTPNTDQVVNHGGDVAFTIAPSTGYHIKDVLVDGSSVGVVTSYSFTNVTADHIFETQFEINSYTIAATVTPVGAGTVTGAGAYNHGATVDLVATANTNFVFVEWKNGETQVSTDAAYSFTATEDLTLTAVFGEIPGDLFFSEYIEGSSNNKALEIHNGTGSEVDLSFYKVNLYSNGSATATNTLTLKGLLQSGEVYVIANSGAIAAILNNADTTSTVTYFNGDDAIGLFKNDELIDVIGVIGTDPGTNWQVAGGAGATSEYTLVRKPYIQSGNTDWALSAGTDAENSEWIVYPSDFVDSLGKHTIVLSDEKDILTFTIADQVSSSINGDDNTISVVMPFGTPVTNLVPTFTISSMATVDPASGVAQNFTNPVVYTVRAQNATTKEWTVTVTFTEPSHDATIASTAYTVDNDAETITNVPFTETLAIFKGNLTPAEKATFEVYQSDGLTVATDLQTGYKVIVTAEDGTTTKTYVVTKNATASTEADILTYSINSVDGVIYHDNDSISVTLPYGTAVTNLVATFSLSLSATAEVATVSQESGVTANDFTNPVVYDVTAEDGTTVVNWIVTVNLEAASTDATLSDLTVDGTSLIGFDPATLNYNYVLPYGTTTVPVVAGVANHAGANAVPTQATNLTGTEVERTATVLVTAQDNTTTKTYSVIFSIASETGNIIFSEYIEGTSSNRAIELFNPGTESVDLSQFVIKQGYNGGDWGYRDGNYMTEYVLPLTGTLAAGEVYVIYNNQAGTEISSVGDLMLTYGTGCDGCRNASFTGDDALGLFKNGVLIDVIGETTGDPGDGWDVAGVTTATFDHTLIRKASITSGNTDWTSSAGTTAENSEWIVKDVDYFDNIGLPSEDENEAPVISDVTLSPTNPTTADNVTITATITDDNTTAVDLEVALYWGTAEGSETNEVAFTQEGFGNTFTGEIPAQAVGTIYYVIEAFDGDWLSEYYGSYSVITGINDPASFVSVHIYPNPSNGQFNIELNAQKAGKFGIEIINVLGQVVYQKQINQDGTYKDMIDITDQAKGLYYIRINDGKLTKVQKLMIQ